MTFSYNTNLRSWLEAQSGSISPADNIRSRLAGTARSAKRTSCEATSSCEASSCEATSLRSNKSAQQTGARSAVSGHTACASSGLWAYLLFHLGTQKYPLYSTLKNPRWLRTLIFVEARAAGRLKASVSLLIYLESRDRYIGRTVLGDPGLGPRCVL